VSDPPVATDDRGRSRSRPLRYVIRLLGFSAPVLLIGLLAYGVISTSPDTRVDDSLARGQAVSAPSFKLAVLQRGTLGPAMTRALAPALSDRELGLEELRGTAVVLNIWASWCVPCADEAPLLERAWRTQGRPRGVLFLGLDMQDVTTDANGFLRQFQIDYLNIRDPTNQVPRSYGATAVPETFFIDRRGLIVGHVIGETSAAQLHDGIVASLSGVVVGARRGGQLRPAR
jgi:cytochrome c biogenesis protein CcmG/thiol:disulfide interchange protein DsbE